MAQIHSAHIILKRKKKSMQVQLESIIQLELNL